MVVVCSQVSTLVFNTTFCLPFLLINGSNKINLVGLFLILCSMTGIHSSDLCINLSHHLGSDTEHIFPMVFWF